jgi:3-deoxy-manno-octulosonate cytidylyltransferase (CMP-KDO synthetase)
VKAFGGKAVMTPVALQSGTDRIAFVAQHLTDADIIVNVQGDEPLIAPDMIDEAVAVVSESDAVVGTLVKRIESDSDLSNPNVVKVVLGNDGNCLYFSRSPIPHVRDVDRDDWTKRHAFYKHIGLYVYRKEFLLHYTTLEHGHLEGAEKLEQLRILEHGFKIKAAITTYDSRPVDTVKDLEYVRNQVKKMNE